MQLASNFSYDSNELFVSEIGKGRFFQLTLEEDRPVVLFRQFNANFPPEKLLDNLGDKDTISWAEAKSSHWSTHRIGDVLIHLHAEKVAEGVKYSLYVSSHGKLAAEEFISIVEGSLLEYHVDNKNKVTPVIFWASTDRGPTAYLRELVAPDWADIRDNYPGQLKKDLDEIMNFKPPFEGGRLLLFHGVPGSGKTHSIRALTKAWSSWCSTSYVVDPERFFGDATYMMTVLLSDPEEMEIMASRLWDEESDVDYGSLEDNAQRWRLLVIEDAEDFLSAEASGQSLSRLLNVADGMIGQGLNLLIMVTTNKEINNINEAVSREGRCLANSHFGMFSEGEAANWLKSQGMTKRVQKNMSLAQLYDTIRKRQQLKNKKDASGPGQYI